MNEIYLKKDMLAISTKKHTINDKKYEKNLLDEKSVNVTP